MDSSGHWHRRRDESDDKLRRELLHSRDPSARTDAPPERPVIEIEIGETIAIVKTNGEKVFGTFYSAEKNRVTIAPRDDSGPRPYLELAEFVTIERATGQGVQAQIWDNRGGRIILRTLPVYV